MTINSFCNLFSCVFCRETRFSLECNQPRHVFTFFSRIRDTKIMPTKNQLYTYTKKDLD
ncbi:hypothetical protein Hanom_Chr03g00265941 [Helianthus anomalus]